MEKFAPLFISAGFGNAINASQLAAVMDYGGATSRNILKGAKEAKQWIDLTGGHRCRCIGILDDGRVAALGLTSTTLMKRITGTIDTGGDDDE